MIAWVLAALLPMVAMVAFHWFPYQQIFRRDLPRLVAYAIGVSTIMTCATIAAWAGGIVLWWQVVVIFWVSAISAGIGTLFAWAIDGGIKKWAQLEAKIDQN